MAPPPGTSASLRVGSGDPATLRPRIVVSRCLGFAAVRYDGAVLRSDFVEALARHVDFLDVCPEIGIGLGVPRDPIRIEVAAASDRRLVQPSTGRDLSEAMRCFAERFLDLVGPVDGFILKSRSPSCGVGDVKEYRAAAAPGGSNDEPLGQRADGFFAEVVRARCPGAVVQDEARLADPRERHDFLVRLFAAARRRVGGGEGEAAAGLPHPYPRELMELTDPGPRGE